MSAFQVLAPVRFSLPANTQTGSSSGCGPASLCEPWREQIEQALAQGLSIQRIYQDLVVERQFAGSYFAVRRFVVRLGKGFSPGYCRILKRCHPLGRLSIGKEIAVPNSFLHRADTAA